MNTFINNLWTIQIYKQTRITKFKLTVVLIIMLYIEIYCGKMSGKTVFLSKWFKKNSQNISNYFGYAVGSFSSMKVLWTKCAFSCCHTLDLRSHQDETMETSSGHRTQFCVLSEGTQIFLVVWPNASFASSNLSGKHKIPS